MIIQIELIFPKDIESQSLNGCRIILICTRSLHKGQ